MLIDYGGWKVDPSRAAMFIVARLMSLAFCYRDGSTEVKDPETSLNRRQNYYKVVEKPTLLEYLSFTLSSCSPFFG